MCELLGLCGSAPFTADVTMRAFARRDKDNADAWGIGWFVDGSLALVKEASAWSASGHAAFLASYERVRSDIFLAHVRRATMGRAGSRANAHPFEREVLGRAYGAAHNGTLRARTLRLGRYRPIGDTDSERLFCHIAEGVAGRGGRLDHERDWRWLGHQLRLLNSLGKLNLLLTDGLRLFAYRDANGFKSLTMRMSRLYSGAPRSLDDPDVEISVRGEGGAHMCAVATHPLSKTGWHDLQPGELLVIERGRPSWSSERSVAAIQRAGRAGSASGDAAPQAHEASDRRPR